TRPRQTAGRDFRRHEAARRHRPRARHGTEGSASRRAVRRARCADPRASAGLGHADPSAAAQHGDHDHPRCRRSGVAVGPHRDDDQWSGRHYRAGASGRSAAAAQAVGAGRGPHLSRGPHCRAGVPLHAAQGAAISSRELRRPDMKRRKPVVIGNGMAPGRALEQLFELQPDAYEVTIFNAEPRVNYDRIMLSPVLSGEKTFQEIVIHGDAWYVKHGVTLYKGCTVTNIDRTARTVTPAAGMVKPYDKLIIATGSLPIIIPVPGHNLAGVLTYRDLDDVHAMMLAARARGRAVVIGGGLLGLEAAAGLREQGIHVTVLHRMLTLMEPRLDRAAGHLV